jgi:hypothetical protein
MTVQVERSWDSETAGRFAALPIESNEKSGANDILGHCEQSLGQNYSEVLLNAHNIRKLPTDSSRTRKYGRCLCLTPGPSITVNLRLRDNICRILWMSGRNERLRVLGQ